MSWDNLPLAEKAEYIKIGVRNGIRDIDSIRDSYNGYIMGNPSSQEGRSRGGLSSLDDLQRVMNQRAYGGVGMMPLTYGHRRKR